MTHFLSLPPEIRNMIYDYCLVVGKVYPLFSKLSWETYGYKEPSTDHQVPDTAILRVSRLVNLEAEKILYSRNSFVMPVLEDMQKLYKHYLHTPRRDALPWIRFVEVTFHTHDLSRTAREKVLERVCSELTREVLSMRPLDHHNLGAIGDEVHNALSISLTENAWERKAMLLTEKLRLQKLTIVLDGPWCLYHCCLLEWEALGCLAGGFVHGLPVRIELAAVFEDEIEEKMVAFIEEGQQVYLEDNGYDIEAMSSDAEEDTEGEESG